MTGKVLLLGFFTFSLNSVGAQTNSPHHPLDALKTDEYWTVHDALVESGRLTDKTLVSSLLLHEPVKDKVLAWKPGDVIPREADVILEADGKTIEARVDIAAHKIEFWKEVPGVQAPITESELNNLSDVVKKDPRVVAALKSHGVTDMSSVRCEPIPVTFMVFPEQTSHRIGYGDCTDSHGAYHSWGRAIEGRQGGTTLPENLMATEIFDGAMKGDPQAQSILQQSARMLAAAIYNMTLVFNCPLFVLGGRVGIHPALFDATEQFLERWSARAPLRLMRSALGADAQLMGAVRLALDTANLRSALPIGDTSSRK